MTALYPMLVSAGDLEPGEPTVVGSNKACVTVTAPDTSFSFNPADYINGLEDGDFVVVVAVSSGAGQGSGVLWNSNWIHLTGPGRSATVAVRQSAIIARFWDSANPTDTMTIDRFGDPTTVCFIVYAFRGASRVKPINGGFVSAASGGSSTNPNSFYWPATRVSGSPDAYLMHTAFFEDNGSVSGSPAPAQESNVITAGTVRAVNHQETDLYHVLSTVVVEPVNGLRNTLGSFNELGTTTRGFSVSNMEYREQSTPVDYDRYMFYAERDDLAAKFYSGTIYAEEDDTIVFTLNNQVYEPTFTFDDVVVLVIEDPDGLTYAQGFDSGGVRTDWNSNFDNVADAFWYDNGNGWTYVLSGILLTAPVTGTYTLTCYVVKEGEPLVWRHQSAPTTTFSPLNVRYLAGGAARNAPPFVEESVLGSTGTFAFGRYAGGTIFRIGRGVPSYSINGNLHMLSHEVVLADSSHRPTQLRAEESVKAIQFTDSSRLELAGSNQPYPANNGLFVYSDSVVLPSYRTTEGGTDVTGKYYFEVEVVESTSDAEIGFGLCSSMRPLSRQDLGSPGGSSMPTTPVVVTGSGSVLSWVTTPVATTTSMATNDIYGFAVDYEGAEIALYKNGNLIYTADMGGSTTGPGPGPRTAWRFFAYIDENSADDFVPLSVNFTGPFVYAKPSGFVAWDFFAEES